VFVFAENILTLEIHSPLTSSRGGGGGRGCSRFAEHIHAYQEDRIRHVATKCGRKKQRGDGRDGSCCRISPIILVSCNLTDVFYALVGGIESEEKGEEKIGGRKKPRKYDMRSKTG